MATVEDGIHAVEVFGNVVIAAVRVFLEALLQPDVVVECAAGFAGAGDFKPIEVIASTVGFGEHDAAAFAEGGDLGGEILGFVGGDGSEDELVFGEDRAVGREAAVAEAGDGILGCLYGFGALGDC